MAVNNNDPYIDYIRQGFGWRNPNKSMFSYTPNLNIQGNPDYLNNVTFGKPYINNNKAIPASAQEFNTMGAVGTTAGVAGGILDNVTQQTKTDIYGREYKVQDNLSAFASGALKGASMGASIGGPIGAIVGALGYGTYSLITNSQNTAKVNREIEGARLRRNKEYSDMAVNNNENAIAQGFKPTGVYTSMYRKGGYIFSNGGMLPQYEVEDNEVVQGADAQLQGQENLASDMTRAVGQTHENGGVMGIGGERVFSDRLKASPALISALSAIKIKVPKNPTYANIASKLGSYKGKFEKKLDSNNPLTFKTGQAMVTRINSLIEAAFQDQELQKQVENILKKKG
jgi:hypothetical protein